MALFSRVHIWVSNEILTASDLNNEFNNLLNSTTATLTVGSSASIGAMQATADPGGVGTESLAASVTDEFQRLRYKLKQLIGGAQWYSTPVGSLSTGGIVTSNLAAGAVTSSELSTGAVVTNKIGAGAVTQAKLGAANSVISSSSSTYQLTGGSTSVPTAVTNMAADFTPITDNRPVEITLVPDGSANDAYVRTIQPSTASSAVTFYLYRDTTLIGRSLMQSVGTGGSDNIAIALPPSAIRFIDTGATAALHTYTLKVLPGTSGDVIRVYYCQLFIVET